MPKLTINITPEQHTQIRVLASLSRSNIKEYILSKIFKQNKMASPRLLAAINEAKDQDSLQSYKTVEALFKKVSSRSEC